MSFKNEAGQSELALRHLAWSLLKERSFHITARKMFKAVRAHCYCASLLRTLINTPRHASGARDKK